MVIATKVAGAAATQQPRRAGNRTVARARKGMAAWLFAAPGLLVYAAFVVYPAARSLWLSFTSWNGIASQEPLVGLANYRAMLHDPVAMTALRNNLLWLVVTTVVPLACGLALAVALSGAARFKPLFRTIFYLPAVLPLVSVATIWGWLYDPDNGAINSLLRDIGLGSLAEPWLGNSNLALWATMAAACWVRIGFPLVLYLAALQNIPQELYEAARVDGASWWRQFRHVTVPGLRATHLVVIALSFIDGLKVFDIIFAMTNGGPGNSTQVMGTWIFFNVFQNYQFGYGAALAVVVTVFALMVGVPYVWYQSKEEGES